MHNTVREDGLPSASAVASTIAFGSAIPADTASLSHFCSCSVHVSARADSSKVAPS